MNERLIHEFKSAIRNIPDFPRKGIMFKDLTTLFRNRVLLGTLIEVLYDYYRDLGITRVVGIESRGFIAGSALAVKLGAGFVPIRKPGKLPAGSYRKEYSLEYGSDAVEIHKDALDDGDIVLLHDDLLATGGTSRAALDLIRLFPVKKIYINFIVELKFLNGRQLFTSPEDIYSVISYEA
ncbi:MAG TPA: adenine phosphoribosyltransferase [Cyclobacteriaceae bacterium]|nr:adenine phosphoribosyltransferase [Cyclobacteriaceae bacterium]